MRIRVAVKTNHDDRTREVIETPETKVQSKWIRRKRCGTSRWLSNRLRRVVALGASMFGAFLFFAIANKGSLEDFIEPVPALAVGGTVPAAASFKVAGGGRTSRKVGPGGIGGRPERAGGPERAAA